MVILGAHNVLEYEEGQIRLPVTPKDTIVHEDYSDVTFIEDENKPIIFENDIALINLKGKKFDFTDTIKPICLNEYYPPTPLK